MATGITGLAFVNERIPPLPGRYTNNPGYVRIDASSYSATYGETPAALVPFNTTLLENALQTPNLPFLLGQRYPPVNNEDSHMLMVEGDVERAVHLYIVHTVNLIFEDYLRRYRQGRHLVCKSQVSEEDSRLDMHWSVSDETILIMEVKIPGSLDPNDWTPAVGMGVNAHTCRNEARARVNAMPTGQISLAEGNAGVILQQVAKYHRRFEPPVVLAKI
ncbi:hypothetical protein GGX14DRAFT_385480 [Mycena pura]|uniref:Uncharacterized protein n=1 Tax=Mycena pura TaxID=153505 RepID=A0AAD7E3G5_9AGAR|nr:hypothetical protein GGX14DRAFT_385480 [Mycena pura]